MNAPLDHLAALAKSARDQTPECPSGELGVPAGESPSAADEVLMSLQQELNRAQRSMRLLLQDRLQSLVGRSLGSLEHNRAMAAAIQAMLDQHGFRLRCYQCGHPAILRVSPRKGIAAGAFVLDHTVEGRRTFHGGTASVPPIHLLAKPERKPRQ